MMPELSLGFFIGCAFATIAIISSPAVGNLQLAQSNYTRCIADGGTQSHCVERYLLPEKEVK